MSLAVYSSPPQNGEQFLKVRQQFMDLLHWQACHLICCGTSDRSLSLGKGTVALHQGIAVVPDARKSTEEGEEGRPTSRRPSFLSALARG
jgi:hypothetical protein